MMTFGPTAPTNLFQGPVTLTNGDPWRSYQTYERTGTSDFGTILYVAGPLDARGDREARDLALLRALEDRYGDRVAYVEAGWDLKDWMAHFERERNLFRELLAFLEEMKVELARARRTCSRTSGSSSGIGAFGFRCWASHRRRSRGPRSGRGARGGGRRSRRRGQKRGVQQHEVRVLHPDPPQRRVP